MHRTHEYMNQLYIKGTQINFQEQTVHMCIYNKNVSSEQTCALILSAKAKGLFSNRPHDKSENHILFVSILN